MGITKSTKVLVVDDFEFMRKTTADQLRSLGAEEIFMANNGAKALRLLYEHPIDIVLSDWRMPVMSGLDLLKAVRGDEKLSHLPFVMITAETERNRIEEAISNGVSDFLVKPYTAGLLSQRVEKALNWKPRKLAVSSSKAGSKTKPPHESSEPASAAKERSRATILVVDDTPDNLHLLSALFKDECQVRISTNGKKALEICTSDNPPDLVLLDIMMPDMDGFEVARRMREHSNSEHIPVIFVTAMTDNDARMKGLDLGAVDFVTKPINPDVLKPRVRNFLRYVELHKQLQSDYDSMLEAARLREDVEHIIRHDLKGPVAGVISLVQTLAEDDSMNVKQTDQLRLVEETALQALNMINLSSEMYKIETGRFKLNAQPVKVADILRRVVEISRNTFEEKSLRLSVENNLKSAGDEAPRSLGDAMFCYSLFQNLVKNACEAAPEKSHVAVTLIDENPLRITIQNAGAVPKDIRERFFEKFVTQGKPDGTGLGTYSAKLLAEAQNGRIALAVSDAKNLTTITVSLPRFLETNA